MNCFESDLDRWIQKREELSHKADELKLQREDLLQASEVSIHHVSVVHLSIHPSCSSLHYFDHSFHSQFIHLYIFSLYSSIIL